MLAAKILSLISIVLLLLWMFYCVAGCLPLLILKYDHPNDARVVHGFFKVNYTVLMGIAAIGALAAAIADRRILAVVIASIALIGLTARRLIVLRMDRLRSTMGSKDAPMIRSFRRLHLTGIALNIILLASFVTALHHLMAGIVLCVEVPSGCQGETCRVQCSLL